MEHAIKTQPQHSPDQGMVLIDDTAWYYLFGPDGLAYLKTRPHADKPVIKTENPARHILVNQLKDYFSGRLSTFTVPLAPEGTAFQQQVWQQLLDVPFGQTVSYGQLAEKLGKPTASRAVGAAVGQNPIWLVIPCHRVIGKNDNAQTGNLTGYAGGLPLKAQLLHLEAGFQPASSKGTA